MLYYYYYAFAIIIIISKRGRQFKAGWERFTPYQSKDHAPQYQPISNEKVNTVQDKKGASSLGQKITLAMHWTI